MLGRFIKRPLVTLLTVWWLWIWVLSVTCREHDSRTCKNSCAKPKPTFRQKGNYYSKFEAKTFIIDVQSQNYKHKQYFSRLHTSTCRKHKETPWKKFIVSPQNTATALSEIWNFGTPKGTVWTQTHWEEKELRLMSVFVIFFTSHNKGKDND